MAGCRRFIERNNLISRGDDTDHGFFIHRDRLRSEGGQKPCFLGPETLSFWDKDRTFGYIFSLFENMLPRRNTSVDFNGGGVYGFGVLDHDHTVGTVRQHAAG